MGKRRARARSAAARNLALGELRAVLLDLAPDAEPLLQLEDDLVRHVGNRVIAGELLQHLGHGHRAGAAAEHQSVQAAQHHLGRI